MGNGHAQLHQGLAIKHLADAMIWDIGDNEYKVLDSIAAAAVELRAWRRALPRGLRGLRYSDDLVLRTLDTEDVTLTPERWEARRILLPDAIQLTVGSWNQPNLFLRRAEATLRVAGIALMTKVTRP